MRPMKNLLASLLVIIMMPYWAYADDGNTFYYYTKSSMTPSKVSLDVLEKLTFSSGGIQLWSNKSMSEIPFEDFLLITFSEMEHPYLTAVDFASMPQDLQMRYFKESRTLHIESVNRIDGVSVYDLQGRMVCRDASPSTHYSISLSSVPKGAYVVRTICDGRIIVSKIVL